MSGPFRTWWACGNFTATAEGLGRLSRVDVGVDVGVVAVLRQQCSNIRYIFLYDSCQSSDEYHGLVTADRK